MIDLSQKYMLFAHTIQCFYVSTLKIVVPLHRQKQIYV